MALPDRDAAVESAGKVSRRAALLELLRERRLSTFRQQPTGGSPATSGWHANLFGRADHSDRYDHIFVLHPSYYASFG
jgi:hypothetical protein